ncbi:hypothetical protein NKDENANG_02414 [Candidatus Entotheonellaceae bacterium PAL068K]
MAASVILVTLNTVYPLFQEHDRWLMGFAFGLLHGFGFASVLLALGLPRSTLSSVPGERQSLRWRAANWPLLALLATGLWLRRSWFYQGLRLVLGSLILATLSSAWLLE